MDIWKHKSCIDIWLLYYLGQRGNKFIWFYELLTILLWLFRLTCVLIIYCYYSFFSFTLYLAYSRVGKGNLVMTLRSPCTAQFETLTSNQSERIEIIRSSEWESNPQRCVYSQTMCRCTTTASIYIIIKKAYKYIKYIFLLYYH